MDTAIKAQVVKVLCDFFEREIPKLPESVDHYKGPNIAGFSGGHKAECQASLDLKRAQSGVN